VLLASTIIAANLKRGPPHWKEKLKRWKQSEAT